MTEYLSKLDGTIIAAVTCENNTYHGSVEQLTNQPEMEALLFDRRFDSFYDPQQNTISIPATRKRKE